MATALTLVNRVRRMLRWGDTSAFDDDQSKVVLDRMNDAVATIFGTWDWECMMRTDGAVFTMAPQTCTSTTIGILDATSNMPVTVILTTAETTTLCTPYRPRVQSYNFSARFRDSSFGIASGWQLNGATATTINLDGFATAASAIASNYTVSVFANEYILADIVKRVVSMSFRGSSIAIRQIYGEMSAADLSVRLERAHRNYSDGPEVAYVGSRVGTSLKTASASTDYQGYGCAIFPTPQAANLLTYTYLSTPRALVATTDTLTGPIPRHPSGSQGWGSTVEIEASLNDLVVALSYARCTQDSVGDADPTAGLSLEQRVLERGEILSRQIGLRRDLTGGDRQEMQARGVPTTGPRAG